MGAFFTAASSQYLSNAAAPIVSTLYPFSLGLWVNVNSIGAEHVFWNVNSGGANNSATMSCTAANTWLLEATIVSDVDITTGTVAAGKWFYVVGRYISATNRRISVLDPSGSASHAQSTTSTVLTTLVRMNIGAFQNTGAASTFFDGYLAEFWYANADIQPDGAQLQDATLRQLAYYGPFSIPSIGQNLLEYRSFYSSQGSETNKPEEVYSGGRDAQAWVNNAGVKIGLHPPLCSGYVRPTDISRLMMV